MTKQEATWASQHDWYVSNEQTSPNNFIVTVKDSFDNALVRFWSHKELREWAGY